MLNSDYMDHTSNGIDTMCFLQHWRRAICVLLTLADFQMFWWPRLRLSLRKIGEMTREEWYAFDLTLLINHGWRWYRRNVKDQRLYFYHLTLGLWFQWVAPESCSARWTWNLSSNIKTIFYCPDSRKNNAHPLRYTLYNPNDRNR